MIRALTPYALDVFLPRLALGVLAVLGALTVIF